MNGHGKGREIMAKSRKLYTVYKNGTDELIAFEETAEKCAELMGIKISRFYNIVCYSEQLGYTIYKIEI